MKTMYEDMIQRDIDTLWPGCSLHFSRRLLTVIDNEVNLNKNYDHSFV